jgi:hypothetical protein
METKTKRKQQIMRSKEKKNKGINKRKEENGLELRFLFG